MGLFSNLLGQGVDTTLDVGTAVMIPIVAAAFADGSVEDEEVAQVRSICVWSPIYARNSADRDTEIIRKAVRLVENLGAEAACVRAREHLSPALRETAFISAVRMAFSDGNVGHKEQQTIESLLNWLGVEPARGRMLVEAVSVMQHGPNA